MAAFTTQFSDQDPFDLPIRTEFFGWPTQIASEAEKLISNRDLGRLSEIASQLDRVIAAVAELENIGMDGPMPRLATLFRDTIDLHPGVFREIYGDCNLLLAGHDDHDWQSEPTQSTRVERFAIFSLWKLIDANLELHHRAHPKGTDQAALTQIRNATHKGGAFTIEAMRALQVAQSLQLEERLISERNRKNRKLSNPNAEANRMKAIEMAGDQPFRSMNKAAEHIANNLVKDIRADGKEAFYSIDWIKVWLREAGWKPMNNRHKAK